MINESIEAVGRTVVRLVGVLRDNDVVSDDEANEILEPIKDYVDEFVDESELEEDND